MHLSRAALVALVVPLRRALLVAQAGVYEDLVLAGVDIIAKTRIPDLLTRRTLPEDVCAEVRLQPTGIDGLDLGLGDAHEALL